MSALTNRIQRIAAAFGKPTSATGLAIFRIAFSFCILLELSQWLYFFELTEGESPPDAQLMRRALLIVHFGLTSAVMLGWRTRIVALLALFTNAFIFGSTHYWEYHVDYLATAACVFMVMAPVGRALSLDAWRNTTHDRPFRRWSVPRGWYWIGMFVGMALVYFDSVFWKSADPMWRAGLGVWRPATLPWATYLPMEWLNAFLNLKPVVVFLGALTFAFEVGFIFLFWFRRARWPFVIVGLGLHIGIGIAFPIPIFGAIVASIYVMLVPAGFWDKVLENVGLAEPHVPLEPLPASDARVGQLLVAAVVAVLALQLVIIVTCSPMGRAPLKRLLGARTMNSVREVVKRNFLPLTRVVAGIVEHPVFMNAHFLLHDHELALVDLETGDFVPVTTSMGQSSLFSTGRLWVNWHFRVVGHHTDTSEVEAGVRNYTRFWLHRAGRWPAESVGAPSVRFEILGRHVDTSVRWEADRLLKNAAQPWVTVGRAEWSGGDFQFHLDDVPSTVAANTPKAQKNE